MDNRLVDGLSLIWWFLTNNRVGRGPNRVLLFRYGQG